MIVFQRNIERVALIVIDHVLKRIEGDVAIKLDVWFYPPIPFVWP